MRTLMSQSTLPMVFTTVALLGITLVGLAQERDRDKIPDKYKWDLSDIYPSEAAWRAAKERIAAGIPALARSRGRLMSSAGTLADALETLSRLDKEISRLMVYASMLADQDTRDSMHQGMRQEMVQLATAFSSEAAFIEPEVLRADTAALENLIAEEPRLTVYRMYLGDIARRAAHTLTASEEKILADAGPLAGSPANIFSILSNADFPYPTVSLSDGRAVKLDQAAFNDLRALPNRADREKVMSAFFQSLGGFGRTYGTTLNGQVQKLLFFAKARNYASSLEMALDGPNVPTSVYTRLIEGVNRNLPAFHRYLRLRQRMLGIDQLHYYDLYAPLVGSVNLQYTPEEAAGARAGGGRAAGTRVRLDPPPGVQRALDRPAADRRQTLGRLLQRRRLRRPPLHADQLQRQVHRRQHAGARARSHDAELLLEPGAALPAGVVSALRGGSRLDVQRVAADRLHAAEHQGRRCPVVAAGKLSREHQGHAVPSDAVRRVRAADARDGAAGAAGGRGHRWPGCTWTSPGSTTATIRASASSTTTSPTNGASFRTSTATSTSTSTPRRLRRRKRWRRRSRAATRPRPRRYLAFLSAGGSKYPIDLLKDAGVDMTTDEPLELTVRAMNRVMDEMERLLAKKPMADLLSSVGLQPDRGSPPEGGHHENRSSSRPEGVRYD